MSYKLEQLRALTLEDNVRWLRSFGCTVEASDGLMRIRNDEVRDYNSWLVLLPTDRALATIGRFVAGSAGDYLYIDAAISDPAVYAALDGARAASVNQTVAAPLPRGRKASGVSVVRADGAKAAADWATLYSTGFGRSAEDAAADRRRWRRAFASPDVQHWFVMANGKRIGVCQTTSGPVRGIYSFTLLPEWRGVRTSFGAVNAILAALASNHTWIYFETLSKSPAAHSRTHPALRLRIIRTLTGYTME